MLLANPEQYADWRQWARAFLGTLNKQEERKIVKLVPYTVATLPPPNEDGMLAFATDEIGGAVPVFSYDGEWKRVTDRAKAIADVSVTVPLSAFTLTANTVTITTM